MEKQLMIYMACMLCLVCANVLCTTNKFSYNTKEMLKENLFVRNIENKKIAIVMYYVTRLIFWQKQIDSGG